MAERHDVPERGIRALPPEADRGRTMPLSQLFHAAPSAVEEVREGLLIFEALAVSSINTSRGLTQRSRLAVQESRQLLIELGRREALSSHL